MRLLIVLCFVFLSLPVLGSSKYDLGPRISDEEVAAKEKKMAEERSKQDLAKAACIQYVKTKLNDPSSADFPIGPEERLRDARGVKQKDGRWLVTFTGRAKNGFGALMMSKFQCKVEQVEHNGEAAMLINSAKQLTQ